MIDYVMLCHSDLSEIILYLKHNCKKVIKSSLKSNAHNALYITFVIKNIK